MDEERITITLDGLGDINATKGVFNVLAITFSDARKQLHREECFALEAKAEKIRRTIHTELEKRGFYNKWKIKKAWWCRAVRFRSTHYPKRDK